MTATTAERRKHLVDATVINVENEIDTTEAVGAPDYTIEELRSFISVATKVGKPNTHKDIVAWNAEISRQTAAKQAAKPASQQLRYAEQSIQQLEKSFAKLQQDTAGYIDDLACAQKMLGIHYDNVAAARADLEKARKKKDELARSLALAAPAESSVASLPTDLWHQLHTASLGAGVA